MPFGSLESGAPPPRICPPGCPPGRVWFIEGATGGRGHLRRRRPCSRCWSVRRGSGTSPCTCGGRRGGGRRGCPPPPSPAISCGHTRRGVGDSGRVFGATMGGAAALHHADVALGLEGDAQPEGGDAVHHHRGERRLHHLMTVAAAMVRSSGKAANQSTDPRAAYSQQQKSRRCRRKKIVRIRK